MRINLSIMERRARRRSGPRGPFGHIVYVLLVFYFFCLHIYFAIATRTSFRILFKQFILSSPFLLLASSSVPGSYTQKLRYLN